MANRLGINLGEVYRTGEAVKTNRLNRKVTEEELNSLQAKRQRTKTINELRGRAAEGKEEAMRDLVALAPEEAEQFIDALDKMDARQRAQVKENVDKLGRMSAYIQDHENPAQAYQYVRENLDPKVAKNMPEQYNPNFIHMSIARAKEMEKILEKKEGKDDQPEAWESRSFEEDGEKVTMVYNPETKKWEEKRSPKWKPEGKSSDEKEKQARKRISQIQKAKAKLEQGEGALQAFLQSNPGLVSDTDDPAMKGVIQSVLDGEFISRETKRRLYEAWEEEERFLRQEYVKTELKGKKEKDKKPKSGATHRFVPGKGLVPIKEK